MFKNLLHGHFFNFIAHYFHEKLNTCADVCGWLKRLGKEYEAYEHKFEEKMVDGFWLLNYVNEEILEDYGVKNETHRQKILYHIDELKKNLSA
jgi:DNA-directed RNA polymerase subunit N (RpoN/RPB10)